MHFAEMIETLTNPYVIDPASEIVLTAGLEVVHAVLLALHGRGQSSVIGSYFLATGRLTSLDHTLQRFCREYIYIYIYIYSFFFNGSDMKNNCILYFILFAKDVLNFWY